jgi:hypothetical protein
MSLYNGRSWHVLLVFCLAVALSACGSSPTPTPEPPTRPPTAPAPDRPATETPTPTPTAAPLPAAATGTPAPPPSRCESLAGQLEVQVLVGPADAVGLEPVAVGSVPFAVTTSESPFLVEGQGPISYEDTLGAEWGTYVVTMDLDMAVQGQCSGETGSEELGLIMEMTGEQLVVVDSPDFHGEYPWSGRQSLNLAFPLEEGATAQGEGWVVVLHLGSP